MQTAMQNSSLQFGMPSGNLSPSSVHLNNSPSKRSHQFSKADRFGQTSAQRLAGGNMGAKRNTTPMIMLNTSSNVDLISDSEMRAQSTLEPRSGKGFESSFGKISQGTSPFGHTGHRFHYSPHAKKQSLINPSPGEKLHHESSFTKRTLFEKSPSSFSFGIGRERMIVTGHEYEKIHVLKNNPSPNKYLPSMPGQFSHRDNGGPRHTLSKMHNFKGLKQQQLDRSRPGPGAHIPEKQLRTFGVEFRHQSMMKTQPGRSFGTGGRFHSPRRAQERAPDAKYDTGFKWSSKETNSQFRHTGFTIFSKDKTDQLGKYKLREQSQMPGPGSYNSHFTEFGGGVI